MTHGKDANPKPPSVHTAIIRTDGPAAITVQPLEGGTWFRLFDAWVESGVWFQLSNAAKNVIVLIAYQCPRKPFQPLAEATISSLSRTTGHTERTVSDALSELERFQCLERLGKPGRVSVFRLRSRTSKHHPCPMEQGCSGEQGSARAQYKNQNQPDQKREEEESKPQCALRDFSGLAGSKPGMEAIENRLFRQDDERSKALFRFLVNAGIREPLRSMLVNCERVSVDECAAIVAEVKTEAAVPGSDILSPGSVMAKRLCQRFGLEMPKKNEAIARMRANGTFETVKRLAAMQKGARL